MVRASLKFQLGILLLVLSFVSWSPAMAAGKKKKAVQKSSAEKKQVEEVSSAEQKPTEEKEKSSAVVQSPPSTPQAVGAEQLRFNTDSAPVSTDPRLPMTFSDPGEAPLGVKPTNLAETVPEDEGFKSYVGYPKHKVGAFVDPEMLSSSWDYNGRSFNFSNSLIRYGLDYRFVISPIWNIEIEYSHYESGLEAGVQKPYVFDESSATFDDYFAKIHYCILSRSNFYRQYCPGFSIGNASYPVLGFKSGTVLEMSRVQDLTLGLDFTFQFPFTDKFLFKAVPGYNYGMGIGNSGSMSSKSNSSFTGQLGVDYQFLAKHNIEALVVAAMRSAKLSGKVGSNDDTWTTNSTSFGMRLGYFYTF